jgi:hypothetical protein
VGSEAALPPEVLGHMFSSLSLPGLGRTRAVCSRWRDAGTLVAGPLWRQQAERLGYLYGWSETAVTRRARGDWRAFVKRELDLERRWTQPRGAALRCRVLTAGHKHWVPGILMEPLTRELVTCSYDGTVRFWSHVDAPRPGCFKVLTAGRNEGFSCLSMLPHAERESMLLAVGSELGHVHVWEVWRPEDAADARDTRDTRTRRAAAGRRPPPLGQRSSTEPSTTSRSRSQSDDDGAAQEDETAPEPPPPPPPPPPSGLAAAAWATGTGTFWAAAQHACAHHGASPFPTGTGTFWAAAQHHVESLVASLPFAPAVATGPSQTSTRTPVNGEEVEEEYGEDEDEDEDVEDDDVDVEDEDEDEDDEEGEEDDDMEGLIAYGGHADDPLMTL